GTNSVLVRVLNPADLSPLVPDTVIARPAGGDQARATIDHIPPGPARLDASARPNADGSGTALAAAATQVQVVSSQTVQVGLALLGIARRVEVSPDTLDILTTKSDALTATAFDAADNVVLGAAFGWTSSAPAVASVSDTGVVTGVGAGNATITATETREGVNGSCAATVSAREATRVEVTPPAAFMRRGDTAQLTAKAFDRDGDQMTAEPFTWTCSATAVASVCDTGLVTAAGEGGATIAAAARSGEQASAQVDVSLFVIKLDWEGDQDLDLHVFGPDYAHASPHSPTIAQGVVVQGDGFPGAREFYSGRAPLQGAYYIAVNYFSGQRPVEAQVTLEGIGAELFTRTYTLTAHNRNSGYPVRTNTPSWFRFADVFIGAADIRAAAPDTTVRLYDGPP
ncbi:MAG TPA: Ig-like domain-containing protein, partial [Armatimonadota bacterium]|nr:Ig-like domain-containing protein [Armatimonadota bacterium]